MGSHQLSLITLIAVLYFSILASAQDPLHTISGQADSVQLKINKGGDIIHQKLDSIQRLAEFDKSIDSIKTIVWADSLRYRINNTYSRKALLIQRKMDSLKGFSLSTSKLEHKLNKIQRKQTQLNQELNQKQSSLQAKIENRYQKYRTQLQTSFRTESPPLNLPARLNSGIPMANNKLPSAMEPGISLPKPPSGLGISDFKELKLSKDLRKVGGSLSLPKTQLKQWENNVPALRQLNAYKARGTTAKQALKDPLVSGEKMVEQLDAIKGVQKQIPGSNILQNNEALRLAQGMKDPAALQQQGLKMATNHFAGKEKELQSAMEQVSKYKTKYTSLPHLEDAKKYWWLRNSLRGMRFKERIRFGVAVGFRAGRDTIHLDLYPTASYRLTGRIEVGLGAIYHFNINTKNISAGKAPNDSWGLSAFTVVKTFKNVFIRFEADGTRHQQDLTTLWRMTYLSGIQTVLPISSRIQGNMQMLYSFDHKLKDSFPDRLVMRLGIGFRLFK